jgi:hypothetical protein
VTLLEEYALGSVEAGTDDWLSVADRIELQRLELKLRKVNCESSVRPRLEGQLCEV